MSPSTVCTVSQTAPATGFYELSCRTKRFSSATRQLPAASSLRRAEVARKAFTAVLVSRTEKPNRRAKGLHRPDADCRDPKELLATSLSQASEPQAYVGAGLRRNGRRLPSLPSVT